MQKHFKPAKQRMALAGTGLWQQKGDYKMKVYYINSTHWDREWYLPFQSFRYKLVQAIDKLMELMEQDPDYPVFWFDGQTIILDDYMEIKPENANRLKKLIQAGRIKVGPWFVMPDEFLVSGESLIRNFMIGHRRAESWGAAPWKYGYVNDIFGHIAQFPQILAGFNINGAYLGRGLGNTDFTHFIWRAPNGSQCYAYVTEYGKFGRKGIDKFGTEEYPALLHAYLDTEVEKSKIPVVLFSNSDDHKMPVEKITAVLNNIAQEYPGFEICSGGPEQMVREVALHAKSLTTVTGELTLPCEKAGNNLKVLFHTLSSYYPLKLLNDIYQNQLENSIEPMVAFSKINGFSLERNFVKKAYEYLLQNHPHDSICGCSVDQVHKDMLYRFDQVSEICSCLCEQVVANGCESALAEHKKCEYRLRVYNAQGFTKRRTVVAEVYFHKKAFPVHSGYALKEDQYKFRLLNNGGEEVPYQVLSVKRNIYKQNPCAFQSENSFDVYSLAFNAELPSMGFADFKIVPAQELPCYSPEKLCYTENSAENEFIQLEIGLDGRLTVTDKRSGRVYGNLNGYQDDGEIGDGWRHQNPLNDAVITDRGVPAKITVISAGSEAVVFKVEKELPVPERLDAVTLERVGQKKLHMVSKIAVFKNEPNIYVKTKIKNNAKDHRLTLMLPTNVAGANYFAGQAFYCCERRCGVDPKTKGWLEEDSLVKNMNGIVGKRGNDGSGLAFVSAAGLHEAGCNNDPHATLNITLYRCFDRVFLQHDATTPQLQQTMEFSYALAPLCQNDSYADLLALRHSLANSELTYSCRFEQGGAPCISKSHLQLSNEKIAVSIFKCAESGEGYILRLFNTSNEPASCSITAAFEFEKAYCCNLNEEIVTALQASNGTVETVFKPWEIVTLKFA